jgi:glucose-1-phosphatase
MQIKNIIFDFGGVIMNIDPSQILLAFKALGIDAEKAHLKILERDLYNQLETGSISPQEFRDGMREAIDQEISDQEIDQAWNSLLLDMPKERIALLENLRKKYRIFMLSNTNAIHYDAFRQKLENEFAYKKFDDLFEKAFFSHRMGCHKPGLEIFKKVIKETGIKPEETLFIDDSFANVESAEQCGLISLHLREGIDLTDLFDEDGLLLQFQKD